MSKLRFYAAMLVSRICKQHAHAVVFCLGVGAFLLSIKFLDKNGRIWYNKIGDGHSSKST